ncbi:MAG: hypothetical protein QOI11_28 [Candidatus Eremiobacteraeota bacterium]|nr:hypothetical protein [Candidatus Eremiobacteraeota bacterium]
MITTTRSALAAVALGAALAATVGPAAARRTEPYLGPPATPLPTLGPVASPGPGALATQSPDPCANDQFLAYRTIPQAGRYDVTVCGVAVALPAAKAAAGVTPAARFALVADGTAPVAVAGPVAANPGDTVLVHGRFVRDRDAGETIVASYVVVNGVTTPGTAQR